MFVEFFFSYNLYLRDKSRSFFARRTIFCKKCWHKQFFHKTVDFWELNINVVWKTTIVSLSVYRAFLVITCICVTNHVLFLLPGMIFCKKCWHKQFYLKTVELWDINIDVVWKNTIVSLSVYRAFLVITCICVTSHVLLWLNMVNFFQEILT